MSALGDYYSAMGKAALNNSSVAGSQIDLNRANARNITAQSIEVAPNAASLRGLQGAQEGLTGAQSNETQQRANTIGPLAQSQISLQGRQGGLLNTQVGTEQGHTDLLHQQAIRTAVDSALQPSIVGSHSGVEDAQGTLLNSQSKLNTQNFSFDPNAGLLRNGFGFSGGTARIPGKGDGSVDTVPAVLASGEAVLNKGAAEHIGRGLIAHLNAIGVAKMTAEGNPPQQGRGMPAPKGKAKGKMKAAGGVDGVEEPGLPQAYAEGTTMVGDPSYGRGLGQGGVLEGKNPFTGNNIMDDVRSMLPGNRPTQAPPATPEQIQKWGKPSPQPRASQNFAMGTEEVKPLAYATSGGGKGNATNGGGAPAPRNGTAGTMRGMPKAKGYAKGTSKVPKGRGAPLQAVPAPGNGPTAMAPAPSMQDMVPSNAPQPYQSGVQMAPELQALLQRAA
jgi:hypothetical protein